MVIKPGRCLLAIRLKEIRKSQQWLSERIGMSKSQISDYATNRTMMSYGTALTIATAIGCHMEDLYEKVIVSSE
ncbi:helix-turn-helix domain-containing protein [Paenibacillus urinalis]|uniref:helix-turn-helix domain-containing protein n=1 Tax=Paenibacillus urinalis TaxID=521520 RepID=UPI0019607F5A